MFDTYKYYTSLLIFFFKNFFFNLCVIKFSFWCIVLWVLTKAYAATIQIQNSSMTPQNYLLLSLCSTPSPSPWLLCSLSLQFCLSENVTEIESYGMQPLSLASVTYNAFEILFCCISSDSSYLHVVIIRCCPTCVCRSIYFSLIFLSSLWIG